MWFAVLAALSLMAYLPFLDNGFISDDWIILDRAQTLLSEPFHLFAKTPDQFRLTSYLFFLLLKTAFGNQPFVFYCAAWTLHLVNALLLVRLAQLVWKAPRTAWTAGLCFAVIQNGHEAVAWLSAVNESLMACFALLTATAWVGGRRGRAAAFFLAALFSKESALVLVLFLPALDLFTPARPSWLRPGLLLEGFRSDGVKSGGRLLGRWLRRYALLLIPAILFLAAYAAALQDHSMLGEGYYALGWQAPGVLLLSLHRLAFPYLYLLLVLIVLTRHRAPIPTLAWGAAGTAAALLPYAFLTYQQHVPSRQTYLACIILSLLLAFLLQQLKPRWACILFLGFFVLGNSAYLWTVKDAQFEKRAAPTVQLRRILKQKEPQEILVAGFPLNPWIARVSVGQLEGWSGQAVHFQDGSCAGCLRLRWDPSSHSYAVSPPP
ncbi:MAG TPA: hypothetical protein VLV83_07440 [Acidobacteriota bacterium]|nr:hypothetical protein [Acidobacteriota bacterium]